MYSEDTFLRKFIGYLRDDFRSDGKVTFQNFCNAMYWIEKATARDKLNAIFNYLNNGNRAGQGHRAPDPAQDHRERLGAGLRPAGRHPDGAAGRQRHEGGGVNAAESYISQDSFVQYCLDRIPKRPPRGPAGLQRDSATRQRPGPTGARAGEADGGRRQPAQAAAAPEGSGGRCRGRLHAGGGGAAGEPAGLPLLLGNKLGFYESDMNQIENLYRGDRFQQLGRGKAAYVITLQKVLQECLMPDIAAELNPEAPG
uniref:EF-hand domain-containing protein n=1 Tax=Macrostomum lignano TaxID=282301 RepID=A0A1I8I5J6_9PLAT